MAMRPVVVEREGVEDDRADFGPKEPLTRREAEDLRRRLRALGGRLSRLQLDLCGLLYRIYYAPVEGDERELPVYQVLWSYASFAEFVETELGISSKTAQRMLRIWHTFGVVLAGKYDRELLAPLGFSKMRVLARLALPTMTSEQINNMLRRAAEVTCVVLENEVEDLLIKLGVRPSRDADRYPFSASLTADELARTERALGLVRRRSGLSRKGQLLDRIIQDWLERQPRGLS